MRAILLWAAAAAVAVPVAAQAPRVEVRALGFGTPTTLHSAASGSVSEATGVMAGGELSLRARSVGLVVRTLAGDLSSASSDGEIALGEVTAQLGPRLLAIEAGYARRGIAGLLGTTVFSFVRVGGASILAIGGTGLSARMSGAVYLAGQGVADTEVSGHVVQTALEYHLRGVPVMVTLGYRTEVFTATSGGIEQSQRLGGIVVGGGLVFGR